MSSDSYMMAAVAKGYNQVNTSRFVEFVTKACRNDENPPKSKHVRRVVNGMLRDNHVTLLMLISIIVDDSHWQTNPILGAKILYLALASYQVFRNSNPPDDGLRKADMVVTHYQNQRSVEENYLPYWNVAMALGTVYHSKIVFHRQFQNVQPNFHTTETKFSPEFLETLRGYVTKVIYESNRMLGAAQNCFPCLVMIQPLIEEAVNSYRLLKFVDTEKACTTTLRDAEMLFDRTQTIPFLKSAIIYPPKYNAIPEARFPGY